MVAEGVVRRNAVATLAAAALLAGCGDGGERGAASSRGRAAGTQTQPRASRVQPSAPRPLRSHRAGWWAPNADLSNTRHVASRIDAANVARLRVAWKVPLRGTYAATVRLLWKGSVGVHDGHDRDSLQAMRGDYSNAAAVASCGRRRCRPDRSHWSLWWATPCCRPVGGAVSTRSGYDPIAPGGLVYR